MIGGRGLEYNMLRKISMDFVIRQLKLRGEEIALSNLYERHDILLKNKGIKIKIKFSKPMKRSTNGKRYWEFTKVVHTSRLWPEDAIDYYLLIGLDDRRDVVKMWRVAADDELIYRKNQVFIPLNECDKFDKYELDIIDNGNNEFVWID